MAIRLIPLSHIARDPELAAFFVRGERDDGAEPMPVASPRHPLLSDGAAERCRYDRDAQSALAVHMGTSRLSRVLEEA